MADHVNANAFGFVGFVLVQGMIADSDEAGHAFQYEAGHLFRSEAGHHSDLKPATQRSLPRIEAIMFRRGGQVKPAEFLVPLGGENRSGGGGQSGQARPP